MKLTLMLAVVASAAAATPAPSLAHHSFAMFDRNKEMTLVGTIKEFQWTNPHSWIQIVVATPGKQGVEWNVEGGSPNSLSRRGWSRTSLKPGDQVTVKINPLKDGKNGGSFVAATLPDGSTLGGGGG